MSDRHMSPQALAERERVMRLRPTESDFKELARRSRGRVRYERFHVAEVGGERVKVQGEAPDGTYTWEAHFKPNDGHGKTTREFDAVGELLKPFQKADIARVENMAPGPALTDQPAGSRGRSRARRVQDERVERGVGRWCLTTPFPFTPVPEGGNPDGTWK